MSRATVLLTFALCTLLAAPQAAGQFSYTLSIEGLPASESSNRSVVVIPFQVTFSVTRAPCIGQAATYTADLAASATTSANNTTVDAQVLPAQVQFTFGPTQAFTSASSTQDAALEVTRGVVLDAVLNATVTVTARISQLQGCGPTATASGFDTDGTVAVTFQPGGEGAPPASSSGEAMPGTPAVLLALALLVAVGMRRRA